MALEIFIETEEGKFDGEPEALSTKELAGDGLKDVKPVPATLKVVENDKAIWELFDGRIIVVGDWDEKYQPLDDEEFRKWTKLVVKTFADRRLDALSIPGILHMSEDNHMIFGWFEDESHPDAMLLYVAETMDE